MGRERQRKENWTSRREKGREEVSERTGSMDWFIRQAVAFFPIICKHSSGPSWYNGAPLARLWFIANQGRIQDAGSVNSATLTHNHGWLILTVLCRCDTLYSNHDLKRRASLVWVVANEWSVGYFSTSLAFHNIFFTYGAMSKEEKAVHPPPASLVPRRLCRSHFGLLMRRQPSAPPPRLLLQLFLLKAKSVKI